MPLCYKDQSWCSAFPTRCANDKCWRAITPDIEAREKLWRRGWGPDYPLFAVADFSESCKELVKP